MKKINELENFLRPYAFVLKEGKEINEDFLDYSLLLLQVGQLDVLRAPSYYVKNKKLANIIFNC